jgi:predicted pyridoxine 5'-phosphate oxidase superfamily flavin-nucleotide-binding protein
MTARFAEVMFTDAVKQVQEEMGSRRAYARLEARASAHPDTLGERERSFIAARDSFYIATVSATGWPYVQHRGGTPGFLEVHDERTLRFPDYQGNRQYVTVGNIRSDDRVSLFLMDYPNQERLKIIGHASASPLRDERIERLIEIRVEAFDWNCSQYITPRYTEAEMALLHPS